MKRKGSHSSDRPATKSDIVRLEKATKADIAYLAKATKADVASLEEATKTDIARLEKVTISEVARLDGHINNLATKDGLNGVENELISTNKEISGLKSEMISLEIRLGIKIDNKFQLVLDQMRWDKMEILGAVANFGKRVNDLETGSNFTAARVVDHEARITHLEAAR